MIKRETQLLQSLQKFPVVCRYLAYCTYVSGGHVSCSARRRALTPCTDSDTVEGVRGPSLVMQCATTCVAKLKRRQPAQRIPLVGVLHLGIQVSAHRGRAAAGQPGSQADG